MKCWQRVCYLSFILDGVAMMDLISSEHYEERMKFGGGERVCGSFSFGKMNERFATLASSLARKTTWQIRKLFT